jgi:dolichol-phosphate mannosyltransferase
MNDTGPLFSVVIPVYNEEGNIPELHRRLTPVLQQMCRKEGFAEESYEILMIDDGSADGTWSRIRDIHQKDARLRGLSFSRNFGHHVAVTAGLDFALGETVILMDGDLQDPPEEIPTLYEKFKEGYDIVYALREKRAAPLFKTIGSWIFLKLLKRISNVEVNINSGIFRIVGRQCVEDIKKMREKSRFLTGMLSWIGYRQTGVLTRRDERYEGRSKYTLFRLIRLAWHGITSFSRVPLQSATYFGFIVAFFSFLYGCYMLLKKLIHGIPIMGYASIIVSLFFLGGIILFVLGSIGEYIGRIYEQVQDRPLYLVKERLQ